MLDKRLSVLYTVCMMTETQTAQAAAATEARDWRGLRRLADAAEHGPAAQLLHRAASGLQDGVQGVPVSARDQHAIDRVLAGSIPSAAPATVEPAQVVTPPARPHHAAHHCRECWNGVSDYPGGLCVDCDSERWA